MAGDKKPPQTFFVIELFDPEDETGLAYWQDHGVWVRGPDKSQLFSLEHQARAAHSVLAQNLLYVRVMYYNPNDKESDGLMLLDAA